jgi:hypothetical protein
MISNAIECRRGGDEIDRIFQKTRSRRVILISNSKKKWGWRFMRRGDFSRHSLPE